MNVIDAKNILTKEMMDKFLSQIKLDDMIVVITPNFELTCNKNTLKDTYRSSQLLDLVNEFGDTIEITIATEECALLLTGYDISWWNKNTRRINKLFKDAFVQMTTYEIACGSVHESSEGNEIVDIHTFKGSKKEMIDFINKEITDRMLQSFMADKVLFSMDYSEEKHSWKTIDELLETGVFA